MGGPKCIIVPQMKTTDKHITNIINRRRHPRHGGTGA